MHYDMEHDFCGLWLNISGAMWNTWVEGDAESWTSLQEPKTSLEVQDADHTAMRSTLNYFTQAIGLCAANDGAIQSSVVVTVVVVEKIIPHVADETIWTYKWNESTNILELSLLRFLVADFPLEDVKLTETPVKTHSPVAVEAGQVAIVVIICITIIVCVGGLLAAYWYVARRGCMCSIGKPEEQPCFKIPCNEASQSETG